MWPQYTYMVLTALGLGIVISKHGEPHPNYNAITSIIASSIFFILLLCGGFFKGMM